MEGGSQDAEPSQNMAIFGTSTGGGMTLAMILRAKQEGLPLPAAIAPGTPRSDLTETGDTHKTNEWLDKVWSATMAICGMRPSFTPTGII
jgi:acetyl esterase/lipase